MLTKELDRKYVANTYNRQDVCFVKGKGSILYDDAGKEYIDMGSGIGVTSFGICDDLWEEAVIKQVQQLNHVSNLYFTEPQVELAALLCAKTGMKKVFFSNSGAEANEGLIKVARKYSVQKYNPDRNVIITLENSFHGRTITTLAATGQDVFHKDFFPFTEGFVYCPANDLDAMKALMEEHNVCGVLLEMIQGEGGVMPLDYDFVHGVAALAKEKDILLLVDEVQTGNGRTGNMYAYMEYGIDPDVVSTAKGLSGGLPMGAVLLNEKTQTVLDLGSHGSTFGGNPICAAGAISVVKRLDDDLFAAVKAKSEYIFKTLEGAEGVISVAGKGLMIGIETTVAPKSIIDGCLARGVVVLSAKHKVRLLPALNIPMDVLTKALTVLTEVIAEEAAKAK